MKSKDDDTDGESGADIVRSAKGTSGEQVLLRKLASYRKVPSRAGGYSKMNGEARARIQDGAVLELAPDTTEARCKSMQPAQKKKNSNDAK